MQPDRTDLKRHYDSLSDEALLEIDPEDLVETARECWLEELSARGLAEESAAEEGALEDADAADGPQTGSQNASQTNLAMVASYDNWDEATMARSLLKTAEIPSALHDLRPARDIQLMVPAELLEDAVAVLEDEISEEELIAQAEAAGEVDEFEAEPEQAPDGKADNPL